MEDGKTITCGKLKISPDDYRKTVDQFFQIVSVEKVEDGSFEAMLEMTEDKGSIGISAADLKHLEENYGKTSEGETNFCDAVMKFQDAIEKYTESIYDRLPDCILHENIELKSATRDEVSQDKELNKEKTVAIRSSKSTLNEGEILILITGVFLIFVMFVSKEISEYAEDENDDKLPPIMSSCSALDIVDGCIQLTKLSEVPLRN